MTGRESLCAALHAPSTCPDCNGHGWYVVTGTEWVSGCCGRYTERGECCEQPELFPEPVPEQAPCERCNMTGLIGPAA